MPGGESFDADLAAAEADLTKLVRRLRSLSPHAWRERRVPVQAALDDLVELSGQLESRTLSSPVVADHVLADAIAVVGGDVLEQLNLTSDVETVRRVGLVLKQALDKTR